MVSMGAVDSSDRSPAARTHIPRPYVPRVLTGKDEVIALLEDKLKDFRAENSLLGRVLQDVQADRQVLEKQCQEMEACVQQQQQELSLATSQQQHLSAHQRSMAAQLQQLQAQQREQEDLIVEQSDTIARRDAQLRAAQQANQELRDTLSELGRPLVVTARPVAPGGGAPGEGGTGAEACAVTYEVALPRQQLASLESAYEAKLAEQLRASQHKAQQRVAALEAEHHRQLAAVQRSTDVVLAQIKGACSSQVQDATSSMERQAQELRKSVVQLEHKLRQQEGRLQEAQARSRDAQQAHQSEVARLKGELAKLQLRSRQDAATARLEADELRAQLATVDKSHKALHEAAASSKALSSQYQQQNRDATSRVEKIRTELVDSVQEVQRLQGEHAAALAATAAAGTHLAAAEAAVQSLRQDVAELRASLLSARTTSLDELMATVTAKQDKARDWGPLPEAVTQRVHLLEYAVVEAAKREAALQQGVAEAVYLEGQARQLLSGARAEQLASQRALLQQVRRMQALEALRLSDLRELHSLEQALGDAKRALTDRMDS